MHTWWRKLGRPALLGFAVGLVVMTGIALLTPSGKSVAADTR